MATRAELSAAVAEIIADYRYGEGIQITARHIATWVDQFDEEVRDEILAETSHVLAQTYISRLRLDQFLRGLVTNAALVGGDPQEFWNSTALLAIQTAGTSQKTMLSILDTHLAATIQLKHRVVHPFRTV